MARQRVQGNTRHEFGIPAQPGKLDLGIAVKLDERKRAKYDVWQKDIDESIPPDVYVDGATTTTHVTWFNNYGLKRRKPKNGGTRDTEDGDLFLANVDAGDEYELELNAEPKKFYVVYTGKDEKGRHTARLLTVANGKASIKIGLGDPNIGDGNA